MAFSRKIDDLCKCISESCHVTFAPDLVSLEFDFALQLTKTATTTTMRPLSGFKILANTKLAAKTFCQSVKSCHTSSHQPILMQIRDLPIVTKLGPSERS